VIGSPIRALWVAAIAALPALGATTGAGASDWPADPSHADLTWDSPSADCNGSMPLGNGDIGLNVWWETAGGLTFYIGKTDSWDENGRLLKLGRVRLRLDPDPLAGSAAPFRQTLHLADATITFDLGAGEDAAQVRLWVDANQPLVHVTIDTRRPAAATMSIESWRRATAPLPSSEVGDPAYEPGRPGNQHVPLTVDADAFLPGAAGRIGWYHHNARSIGPGMTAALQDMEGYPQPDPLLHRTFGALIRASDAIASGNDTLRRPAATSHRFAIAALTAHPASPDEWLARIDPIAQQAATADPAAARAAHESWWRDFWDRSFIRVTSATDPQGAADVTRAYALQRFVNACGGRGAYPIKFNGSTFNVAHPGAPGDADYRRWGAGYWWQNTRLPYVSMCTSGDFDLMAPLFRMYAGEHLEMAKHRTRHYFGHGGAYLNECAYFWGAAFNESYGWTPRAERTLTINESRWHRWEWQGGLELLFMMLDFYEHTLDEAFRQQTLLPFADAILTFYDLHYADDATGRMVIEPAQALETWWECTNPMPEVAGLDAVTQRLLALPATEPAGAPQRALWRRLRARTPALPTRTVDGAPVLAPAERFAQKQNVENPELYAVFPYRRIAVGRPGTDLGIEALRQRDDRGHSGWRQDDIFMAYLGLADETRDALAARTRDRHAASRFPAFFGPNYDWTPDQCHGGVLLKVLQAMLIQTDGRAIHLLPAWPADWDADFRLHAPLRTMVEGRVRGGVVQDLTVEPPARRAEVVLPGPQRSP
jgi:hypothetical protein